ncbi:expressed unknown protein [Seminavis robusta]|uniref:Uncharacterized protein n=1 Tax=Seminavis robusta TaxID=568900 RepID=A0A9N8E5F9_9STRA|nr:expressed unknown protein [Seminavis robusta]|eukprot:Sro519_g158910.1 n/a (484) ;mRNA; r:626-2077
MGGSCCHATVLDVEHCKHELEQTPGTTAATNNIMESLRQWDQQSISGIVEELPTGPSINIRVDSLDGLRNAVAFFQTDQSSPVFLEVDLALLLVVVFENDDIILALIDALQTYEPWIWAVRVIIREEPQRRRGDFGPLLVESLFGAIGRLPHLQCFFRGNVDSHNRVSPTLESVRTLTECLSGAASILRVLVVDWNLTGTAQEFVEFSKALERCQQLRTVKLRCGWIVLDLTCKEYHRGCLESLLVALAKLPRLQQFQLANPWPIDDTGTALVQLCCRPSLQTLSLGVQVEPIMQILAQAMREGTSQLKQLTFVSKWKGDDEDNLLSDIVRYGRSLEKLHMFLNPQNKRHLSLNQFLQALGGHTTLASCAIMLNPNIVKRGMRLSLLCPSTVDSILTMLEQNTTLTEFKIEGDNNAFSPRQQAKMDLYIKLNQLGRGALLSGSSSNNNETTRATWVDTLIANKNDLDVLFYFVLVNPTLCENE